MQIGYIFNFIFPSCPIGHLIGYEIIYFNRKFAYAIGYGNEPSRLSYHSDTVDSLSMLVQLPVANFLDNSAVKTVKAEPAVS